MYLGLSEEQANKLAAHENEALYNPTEENFMFNN